LLRQNPLIWGNFNVPSNLGPHQKGLRPCFFFIKHPQVLRVLPCSRPPRPFSLDPQQISGRSPNFDSFHQCILLGIESQQLKGLASLSMLDRLPCIFLPPPSKRPEAPISIVNVWNTTMYIFSASFPVSVRPHVATLPLFPPQPPQLPNPPPPVTEPPPYPPLYNPNLPSWFSGRTCTLLSYPAKTAFFSPRREACRLICFFTPVFWPNLAPPPPQCPVFPRQQCSFLFCLSPRGSQEFNLFQTNTGFDYCVFFPPSPRRAGVTWHTPPPPH